MTELPVYYIFIIITLLQLKLHSKNEPTQLFKLKLKRRSTINTY